MFPFRLNAEVSMKRPVVNIFIDAFSLIIFTSMISTGLLLYFVLPPGSGRVEMLDRGGRGFEKTIDVFWGLTRHEWGNIHLIIALVFLAFLIIHLILHWSWIKAVTFGTKNKPQPLKRKIITVVGVLAVVVIMALPWIGGKETLTRSEFLQTRPLGTQN